MNWQPIAVPGFVAMHVRREGRGADSVTMADVGPMRVIDSHNGPGEAVRDSRDIRSDDDERYALFVQADGMSIGEQDGRTARFRPGDLGVVDLSRPMRCKYSSRRVILVTYPKLLSPLRTSEIDPFIGARISGEAGTAALVSGLVRQLPQHLDADDGASGARIGGAVLDLIHAGLAAKADRPSAVSPEIHRRELLVRCRAYIEQNLADKTLSPAGVAAAHHISLRFLHRLFEPTGQGVAELIRRRRLDRARRDLLDPEQCGRPVAAIGASWGLADPGHFSRAFKREYGLPPGEFRAAFSSVAERMDG
ncbi:helix-turn-helix domain-containing protein [Kribbella sp. NPDC026611]|uniref:helix-turn-helix domain-containing protein n=1 Tax=Kribbella sp. NPDC026611 TaxID=3154911 RepID=UPI0033C4B6A7